MTKLTNTEQRKTGKISANAYSHSAGTYAEILSVKTRDGDRLVAEGLVRSALNFAANRNAYMARANVGRVEKEPFITLGFEEKNGFYESDIPSALTGSCGHCAK